MIEGISHLTFVVSDLDRMTQLLVDVLGGREVYSSGEEVFSISPEKFFILGGIWIATMKGDPLREKTYNHVALKISERDLPRYRAAIEALGLEVCESRSRVQGEGQSIYFYDFDNHLFELHTGTLDERLARYSVGRDAVPAK